MLCLTDTQEERSKQNELGSVNREITAHMRHFCPHYHFSHSTYSCLYCWLLHFAADNNTGCVATKQLIQSLCLCRLAKTARMGSVMLFFYWRLETNITNIYWRFVGKHVVRWILIYRTVRGQKSTKARINAIENKCGDCFCFHAPPEDSSVQYFFPFHDLCSTVFEIVFCYLDVTVAAEDQYGISRVGTDGEWRRFSGISEQECCN